MPVYAAFTEYTVLDPYPLQSCMPITLLSTHCVIVDYLIQQCMCAHAEQQKSWRCIKRCTYTALYHLNTVLNSTFVLTVCKPSQDYLRYCSIQSIEGRLVCKVYNILNSCGRNTGKDIRMSVTPDSLKPYIGLVLTT